MDDCALEQTHYDCLVLGTGLVPCIVGAALARAGKSVLFLDNHESYGGSSSSVSLGDFDAFARAHAHAALPQPYRCDALSFAEQYSTWRACVRSACAGAGACPESLDEQRIAHLEFAVCASSVHTSTDCFFDASVPSSAANGTPHVLLKRTRSFNIDLSPKLLYARGDFVELLVRSAVSKYLEFRCLNTTYTYLDHAFHKVPVTKSDVFSSSLLNMVEKRQMMKLSHAVFGAGASEDPHARDAVNQSNLQRTHRH